MKKQLLLLSFLILNSSFLIGVATAQNWVNEGNPGFSAGLAHYTSIAINGSGTPYVVYRDLGNSYKATVMKHNGTSWETAGTAGFSVGSVNYTSIAIDGSGTPYVVYQDGGNGNKATVMKYNGSSWVDVGTAGFSAWSADHTSIAIDGSGTPYVVYKDFGNSYKATVMKYNGSSWVNVGNAGFSAGSVEHTRIAIDGSGTPYVVYRDQGNTGKITVMKYNGSNWASVGPAGFAALSANYTSIAIDGSGTPYVVYRDYGDNDKATVMKYNGSSWVTVGNVGLSTSAAAYTSIAIDGSGTPYVVYQDAGSSNKATVMKYIDVTIGAISPLAFCAGANVNVPFTITSTVTAGNVFTAQLSNASGSFASPVAIGTLSSTAGGTINATIPGGTTAGTGYRMRVVSSTPVVMGSDNGTDLSIASLSTWYLDADSDGYYVSSTMACTSPGVGYNTTATILGDCDDDIAAVNSGATEICDGIDNNCDGLVDEVCTYVPDDYFENYLEANGMGNGIALDDYVTTANINTVTSLDVEGLSIADLTGIEDFAALQELRCGDNLLTSLNVAQNTALTTLRCEINQLTTLDVSPNPALIRLDCYSNLLSTLNILQNTALQRLDCWSNHLNNIVGLQNAVLYRLACSDNQFTSLDLSQTPSLTFLRCAINPLTSLNVKNGNNTNITIYNSQPTPNLLCIEVDDAAYSTNNWTNVDAVSAFSENCSSCDSPTTYSTTGILDDRATMNWSGVFSGLEYKIRIREVGGQWTYITETGLSKTKAGLTPGTDYEWQVKVVCNGTQSSFGPLQYFSTYLVSPCPLPDTYSTTLIQGDRATLGWSTVGAATAYKIRIREVNTSNWTNIYEGAPSTSKIKAGLTPGTNYEWQLRIRCSSVQTAYGPMQYFTTGPACPKPVGFSVSNILEDRATMNWSTVTDAVEYKVKIRPLPAGPWSYLTVTAPDIYKTKAGLDPETDYQWRVRSVCATTRSPFASVQSFTTLPETPKAEGRLMGTEDSEEQDFYVYPNPTTGEITIDLGSVQEKVSVIVRNTLGQDVFKGNFQERAQFNLEIPGSAGLYTVQIQTEDGMSDMIRVMKN